MKSKSLEVRVQKVDATIGVVFGFAIVCKADGEDFYDSQGDNIPEDAMLEATSRFMTGDRVAKDMHRGEPCGQVLYGFPLTEDVAKAMGIQSSRTGFLVGMRPTDSSMLEKYASGDYTGFSIGGRRVIDTEVTQ